MPAFRPDALALLTGRLSPSPRPESISEPGGGGKFTPDGAVLPFPGNTIICHVDEGSRAHAALCRMQAALKAGPQARHFVYMPPASFHMTLFQGVSGPVPRLREWPAGIPVETPRDEISRILLSRLAGLGAPSRVRVRPVELFAGFSLTLEGADAAEEGALRALREALREATGIAPPAFERYTFHITLAYLMSWLDDAAARAVIALGRELHAGFAQEIGEIVLGPPEFCEFEDMLHFERLAVLGGEAGRRANGTAM